MTTAFTIIIVFLSLILVALVLFQKSKGGGLASGFASGNQVLGAPKTTEFLEKATWTIAAIIVFLSVLTVGFQDGKNKKGKNEPEVMTTNEPKSAESATPTASPFTPEQTTEDAE